jgi:autotransporter-associated beta strand protein
MRSLLPAALISLLSIACGTAAEQTWTGGGGLGTSSWTMAINWTSGAPGGGDSLVFPSVTYKTAVNDFTAGTAFGPLTINAGGYVFSGNLVNLKSGIFLNGANTAQVALPLQVDTLITFTVSNQSGVLNLNQPISGAGGITKSGPGLLVINNNHSYTGPTILSGGGLQVGGSLPGTVQISSGDLLGTGAVGGILALNQGVVRIAPGTSSAVGTLTCNGDLRLYASDALLFDVISTGADKLTVNPGVNGSINLGQAALGVTVQSGYVPAVGTTWVLVDNTGTAPLVGAGATPSDFLIPTFVRNGQRFQVSFVGGTGRNDVVLSKVGPQNASITSFTTSDSTIAYGDPVTFTAMVTGTVSGSLVSFWDGNEYIGSATLSGAGQAQLVGVTTLKPGARSITALFEGNATYAPVQSGVLTENVAGFTTTTGLAVTPSTSSPGGLVTLTATVSSGASPTGTVTFYDGSAAIGSPVTVSSNQAVTTTSSLVAGAHSLSAIFNGSGAFFDSPISNVVSHTVTGGAATTVSVGCPNNPAVAGTEITFTATVTGGANAGTVVFKDGAITLTSVALASNGTATFTTGALPAGIHSITAVYQGTIDFEPSTSSAFSQTITASPGSGGSGGGPVELQPSSGCGLGGGAATLVLGLLLLVGLRLRRE